MNVCFKRALLWFVFALAVAGSGLFQLLEKSSIQTDLLALLPPTERNPLAEQAIARLAEINGHRVTFLVGLSDRKDTGRAVRLFAERLRASGAFRQLVADLPPLDSRAIAETYLGCRFNFLNAADRAALESNGMDLSKRLMQRLYAPFRFGLPLPVDEDPFGFLEAWMSGLPLKNSRLTPEDGILVARSPGKVWGLIVGELAYPAYDSDFQRRFGAALDVAESELRARFSGVELLRAGTFFYARAARMDAESEMDFIGLISTVCIVVLLYRVFRSFLPLALGLLAVGFGVLTAAVVSVAVFGELHLMTLVFGASLIGDAVDFPIQYFSARLAASSAWEPRTGIRRIAPGLTMALVVGVLGYGALIFLPFPALWQISVFSMTGLCATWLTVLLLLPFLSQSPDTRGNESLLLLTQNFLARLQAGKRWLFVGVGGALLALPGCFLLQWNDDVHLLISRSPDLTAQENRIRDLTGYSGGSQFFLVEGKTPDEALYNEEKLAARLSVLAEQGVIAGFYGIASFVPSMERQRENRWLWEQRVFSDREKLRRILSDAGLRESVADAQIERFDAAKDRFLQVADWLQTPLASPFRPLWLGETPQGFAQIVLVQNIRDMARLQAALDPALDGVTFVDKAGSVSGLFKRYRETGGSWLFYALGLIYAALFARYGIFRAARLLCPALLSMILAAGVFGYLRIPMTLFNILSLMLVLCVSVSYAIHLFEGGVNVAATLLGVLLSAMTDLLSFGLLSFSSTPALSGFGLTLLLGIGASILLTPGILARRE